MSALDIRIVFISIGDAEKLSLFLEKNPLLERALVLTDGYSLDAYNKVGFTNIGDNLDLSMKGIRRFHIPNLSSEQWKDYSNTMAKLTPLTTLWDIWKLPEGVRRLGGTFALEDQNILYGSEEGLPGDNPNPDDVILELLNLF